MHRQMRFIPTLLLVCFTFIFQATANDLPEWKLVYQNDFEYNCDWISYNSQLTLKDGWLHIKATAFEGLAFAPGTYPENVRFEFDARIDPADWAGDLTPLLAANRIFGWYSGYRLSFAASQNTKCYISGPLRSSPSITAFPDPTHAGVLHFVAEKTGRKVSLSVNNQRLLELEHPEYVGGRGRDQVGVLTRIGAILIDNVRIFTAPARQIRPVASKFSKRASAEAVRCDSLVLAGNFSGATDKIPTIPDAETRITFWLGLLNSLEPETHVIVPHLLRELKNLPENQRDSSLLTQTEKLMALTDPATEYRLRAYLSLVLLYDSEPLAGPARLFAAKTAWWGALEYHFPWYQTFADSLFHVLYDQYPANQLIQMYLGEKIIWEPGLILENAGPRWAGLLREYYVRALKIIEFWVTGRQDASGALGGGWGDDVEILRQWNPVVAISANSQTARAGIHRLADGVWQSGEIDTLHGFSAKISDVEHSAEPSADSQPPMLLLAPGDPKYVTRNFAAVRQMRDFWTGIAPDGFRRFRTNTFSATEIVTQPPFTVDVPYSHRAARHAAWLLSQGKYPAVENLLREWAESWLAACLSEENGKPRGIAPAAIRFEDGKIGGYGPTWWNPNLGYPYYHWGIGNHDWILQLLNLGYKITGEERFLEPLKISLELSLRERVAAPRPGSIDWVAAELRQNRARLAREALASGANSFAHYIRQFASPAVRFRMTGDDRPLCETIETALAQLRYNWPLLTSEILATDRASLPAVEDLFQAFTGAISDWSGFTPANPAVCWDVPTPNFAALVQRNDDQTFQASLFHFEKKPVQITARFLELRAGVYQMSLARDQDGDHQGEEIIENREIQLQPGEMQVQFTVPAQTAVVLQLHQKQKVVKNEIPVAHLVLRREGAEIGLYNLGVGAARKVRLRFWDAAEKIIQRESIPEIAGVTDLSVPKILLRPLPGTRKIQVTWSNENGSEGNHGLKIE